jgi:phospholipid/cholesterol/gamma-HCH transport system permease protein
VAGSSGTLTASTGSSGSAVVSLGRWVTAQTASLVEKLDFLGATLHATVRLLRRPSPAARAALAAALRDAGMGSLPIVALMGFVAGLVLTLLGTKELGKIGIETGIPRLVGVVVLREIGVLIVGIALAGRVASSYAAEIAAAIGGDAKGRPHPSDLAFGVQIAPRVAALVVAAPLLLAYTNTMAVAGSALYGATSLPMAREHASAMLSALNLKHTIAGLVKAIAFGFAVSLAGCYHGWRAAAGSEAIGHAARRAVVAAVLLVGLAEVGLIFAFKWIRL